MTESRSEGIGAVTGSAQLTSLVGARAFHADEADDFDCARPFGDFSPPRRSTTDGVGAVTGSLR